MNTATKPSKTFMTLDRCVIAILLKKGRDPKYSTGAEVNRMMKITSDLS
jgi:hypothetical protein